MSDDAPEAQRAPTTSHSRTGFLSARMRLARLEVGDPEGLDRVFEHALRLSADQLGVEHAGLWFYDPSHAVLARHVGYTRSTGETDRSEAQLRAVEIPRYVAGLEQHRAIVAHDVATHPLTEEIRDAYLTPHGITSMLDTPIYRHGVVVGAVCHEHVGPARTWSPREIDFAASVADMISLYLERAAVVHAESTLRARERALLEAERLAAVGVAARRFAHDLNNALSPVLACAGQIERGWAGDAKLVELARIIREAAEHGAALARRMLEVPGPGGRTVGPVHLTALVDATLPLLRAVAGPDVTVERAGGEADLVVEADPDELVRVLVNLVKNARDAMRERGAVRIRLGAAGARPRPLATIDVEDDGSGVPADLLPRLFEPFFTTKPGRGQGLGLPSVRAVVESLGGTVSASSRPGAGTTIAIQLPRSA